MTLPPLTLHIWPAKWDLPSMEPASLAAVLYLQLSIPGRFRVVESTNPDLSPSGQLPYLTHGHHIVTPASSIFKYIAALTPESLPQANNQESAFSTDLDALLSTPQRAKRTAWRAHVESTLGDLVAHMFYSLPTNYNGLTHPALASSLSVPQRYYVPQRVRDLHRVRLEASGLWNLSGEEIEDVEAERKVFGQKEKKRDEEPKKVFKGAFERERVLERARAAFDLYARLLGDERFFFYDRPTSLDVLLAAHTLLLLNPPFPDPLLPSLLSTSYPSLLAHARRVLSAAFPQSTPPSEQLQMLPPQSYSLRGLLPYPALQAPWRTNETKQKEVEKSEKDREFDRKRWQWIGLAAVSAVGYWLYLGLAIVINFKGDEGEDLVDGEAEELVDGDEGGGDDVSDGQ